VTGASAAPTWVDSHCHLQSLEGGADPALERARAAGVAWVVCVGTDLASTRAAVDLSARHPDVAATAGLHPHDASHFDEEWPALADLARAPEVVAVGETGFDFYYRHSPADEQERAFRAQIALAHELERALVIHTRDAWDDTFRVLTDAGVPERTVFHCFTGGPDEARRALDLGAWVSFSGIVSFKNADDVRAAAVVTPFERILVETDAPYLAPVPHRGRENEPAWVVDVGHALAAATGRAHGEIAAATHANTETLFQFPRHAS
jgi:TatD DNase family protein